MVEEFACTLIEYSSITRVSPKADLRTSVTDGLAIVFLVFT